MKTSILSLKIVLAIFFGFLASNAFGQAANATWALTANVSSAVTGNVSATGGTQTGVTSSNPAFNSNGWGAFGWQTVNSLNNGTYYEFTVSPSTGNSLNVTRFSYDASYYGTVWIDGDVYYSTNNFTTSTKIGNTSRFNTGGVISTIDTTGLNIPVAASGQIKFRIYFYYSDGTTSTYLTRVRNVKVTGTTTGTVACSGRPNPGSTIATPSNVTVGGSTVLSLQNATAGTGITYQWQSSPTNIVGSWSNITVATSSTYSASPTVKTYYRCIVTCSGNSGTSSSVEITIKPCASTPTSLDGNGITNVTVGSNSFPVSAATYTNFITPVPDLTAGANNNVKVTFATGFSYNSNIWIDFNDDGVFVSSELVKSAESINANPTTLDLSFLLNSFANLGQHKMRIGTADYGQATPNPCYSGTYGVTVDLLVNIIALPLPTITGFGTSNGCVGSSFIITGTNFTGASAVTIGGTAVSSYIVNSSTQITAVVGSGTTGTIKVTTAGGTGTSSGTFTVNPSPATTTVSGAGTFCGSATIIASGGTGGAMYFQGTTSGGTSTATASSSQSVTSSGTYYFRSQSSAGCWGTEGSVTVVVNNTPAITTNPTDKNINAGANTSFTVGANNTPTSYTWQVSTDNGGTWTTVTNGGVYTNAATSTLNITGATVGMNGYLYHGSATNSCGKSAYSASATLTVVDSSCGSVTASASKYVICANEATTLTASSTTTGYTYTWYKDWDNNTHSGTIVGTGASIMVNPAASILYGVVATKTGCPIGFDAAYNLISISVTPPPTLIVLDPIAAITCSNEYRKISVVSGGIIPNEPLTETWDPISNPWIRISGSGVPVSQRWSLYNSGGAISSNSGKYIMVRSDGYMDPMESSLVSPPFSLLDYDSPVNLTFAHYFRQYYNESTAYVEITKDGTYWTNLDFYTSNVGNATNFYNQTINLDSYVGEPYLQIRFRYEAKNAWYWAIDNIKITGVPLPTTVKWSPTTGLYNDAAGTTNYAGGDTRTVYASPSSTTTYTAAARTAVGCPATVNVTVERGDKEWGYGGLNAKWNTPNNWSEGTVPTANHCVNIASNSIKPIIVAGQGTDAFAKNLTVQIGGQLTVSGNLTVTDFVKNNGTASDLVIASDGNLKQITENCTNSGNITVKRDSPMKKNDYTYWSSPVSGQNLFGFSLGTSHTRFYEYHESDDMFWNPAETEFKPGKGYAIMAPSNFTPASQTFFGSFAGVPNNGTNSNLEFRLKLSSNIMEDDKGYNMIGNPYPSNIDFDKLFTNNGGINGRIYQTAYFWTNIDPNRQGSTNGTGSTYSGNAYAIYNGVGGVPPADILGAHGGTPTNIIKVGQGFIVKARPFQNDKTLIFNNTIRTTESTHFFSKGSASEKDRYWLKLTSPALDVNTILIGYVPGATNNFEWDYDAPLLSVGSDSFYSLLNEDKLGIQGRTYPLNQQDIVALGTKHFDGGNYTISLGDHEGIFADTQNIYLKDKQTGIITNLSEGSYTFTANIGERSTRFEIIYEPQTVLATIATVKDKLIVYRDDNDFVVKTLRGKIDDLEMYDSSGRLLYKVQPNSIQAIIPTGRFTHGVYILKINQAGSIMTKKIMK